jgi:hypothetical protein
MTDPDPLRSMGPQAVSPRQPASPHKPYTPDARQKPKGPNPSAGVPSPRAPAWVSAWHSAFARLSRRPWRRPSRAPFRHTPFAATTQGSQGRTHRGAFSLCLAAACLFSSGSPVALAASRGHTAQAWPWVSGGVSIEERRAMRQTASGYSLWVITATEHSGAFLANVRLRVKTEQGQTIFDGALDGPWLFIDLPLGRYTLEAHFAGSARSPVQDEVRTTTIHPGDHHQVVFYFDQPQGPVSAPPSSGRGEP